MCEEVERNIFTLKTQDLHICTLIFLLQEAWLVISMLLVQDFCLAGGGGSTQSRNVLRHVLRYLFYENQIPTTTIFYLTSDSAVYYILLNAKFIEICCFNSLSIKYF